MKYFYIVANYEKEYARETEKQIVSFLKERGAVCRTQSEGADSAGSRRTARADVPKETQCLITIGGDGTLIRAAREEFDEEFEGQTYVPIPDEVKPRAISDIQ